MSLTEEEIGFARDLFSGLGEVSCRRMFGGVGLYHGGRIFAVMRSDGAVLLKGAQGFGEMIAAAGGTHWVVERANGAKGAMPYWSLPEAALDDPELACDWARRALAHL